MKVIMFSPRFAPLVKAGTKTQTIRGKRKVPILVGDKLSLREWTGLPYRTPQKLLREAVCTEVSTVALTEGLISTGDGIIVFQNERRLSFDELSDFAQRDGFRHIIDMLMWFDESHGLPFVGQLIRWS